LIPNLNLKSSKKETNDEAITDIAETEVLHQERLNESSEEEEEHVSEGDHKRKV